MGQVGSSWVRLALVVAVLGPAGCGRDAGGAAGAEGADCPLVPVWDRAVDSSGDRPRWGGVSPISTGVGGTPDDAVRSLATGIGIDIRVEATRPVGPTALPEDDLELDVVDERGETGTYLLAEEAGSWIVSGGVGCGAPAPADVGQGAGACPTPSVAPGTRPRDEIVVLCNS